VVGNFSFAITSNDNNQVTGISVTAVVPNNAALEINGARSLTTGTGNSQN
jgi:hypothetical protein